MTDFEIYAKQHRLDVSTDANGRYLWRSTAIAAEAFEAGLRVRAASDDAARVDNLRDAGPAPFGGRNAGLRREGES